MKKIVLFAFLCITSFCLGNINVSDPISLSLGESIINSTGVENLSIPKYKSIYLSFGSHLLSKELKGGRGDFSLSNHYINSKFSFSGYGYKHYNYFQFSVLVSKNISQNLAIGAIIELNSFYHLGIEKRKYQLLPGLGISYQHSKKRFYSQLIWENPLFIVRKNYFYHFENSLLSLGLNLVISAQTRATFEIDWINQSEIIGKCGFLYSYKLFDVRCGIKFPSFHPTIGTGFENGKFRIDLAAHYLHPLGINLTLGVGYKF